MTPHLFVDPHATVHTCVALALILYLAIQLLLGLTQGLRRLLVACPAIWAFGGNPLPGVSALSPVTLLGGILFGVLVAHTFRPAKRAQTRSQMLTVGAFCLAALPSIVMDGDFRSGATTYLRVVTPVLFMVVVARSIHTFRDIFAYLEAMARSTLVLLAVIVVARLEGQYTTNFGEIERLGLLHIPTQQIGYYTIALSAVFLTLYAVKRNGWYLAALPLLSGIAYLTFLRTAWLGVAMLLVGATIILSRYRALRVAVVVTVACAALFSGEILQAVTRYRATWASVDDADATLSGRIKIDSVMLRTYLSARPVNQVLGLGGGSSLRYTAESEIGTPMCTHDDYLAMTVELGAAPFVLYMALVFSVFRRLPALAKANAMVTRGIGKIGIPFAATYLVTGAVAAWYANVFGGLYVFGLFGIIISCPGPAEFARSPRCNGSSTAHVGLVARRMSPQRRGVTLIENCDFDSHPPGGQLAWMRIAAKCLGQADFALVGVRTDDGPVGEWTTRNIDGTERPFFAVGRRRSRGGKPLVPERLRFFFELRLHKRAILSGCCDSVFLAAPEALLAVRDWEWRQICYTFSGVENPLRRPRYRWAKALGPAFDYCQLTAAAEADVLIAHADLASIRDVCKRSNGRLSPDAIIQIPTAFDPMVFCPQPSSGSRRALGLAPKAPTFVCCGRLSYHKGWDRVLTGFQEVLTSRPDAVLVFVGDGEDEARLRAEIALRRMERAVVLAGRQNEVTVAAYLNAADVVVFGSRREGWCTALVEAAACGKRVVSTDVGGACSLIVPGVTGFLADASTAEDLGEKMALALDLPEPPALSQATVAVAQSSRAAVNRKLRQACNWPAPCEADAPNQ